MTNTKKYFSGRHYYTDFEKNERRNRKVNRVRSSCTSSLRELALNQVSEYFDKKVLPDHKRLEFRWMIRLQDNWQDICGALLSTHLRPYSIQKGCLIIEASSGLFLEQARLIEKQFMSRIHQFVPEISLQSFELKVGDFNVPELPLCKDEETIRRRHRAQLLSENKL